MSSTESGTVSGVGTGTVPRPTPPAYVSLVDEKKRTPAPPRIRIRAIADPGVANVWLGADRLLVEDAPAVVHERRLSQRGEQRRQVELGVFRVIRDHEHAVGARESLADARHIHTEPFQ